MVCILLSKQCDLKVFKFPKAKIMFPNVVNRSTDKHTILLVNYTPTSFAEPD